MNYFEFTKESCHYLIEEIKRFHSRFQISTITSYQEETLLQSMAEICSINSSLLCSIRKIKENVLEGQINNHRTYYESDLKMIDVILHIYHQCDEKNTVARSTNGQKLQQQLSKQVAFLEDALDYFPDDLAINVKQKPTVITNISLDYYQFIYLALSQTLLELQGIKIKRRLTKLAALKTID